MDKDFATFYKFLKSRTPEVLGYPCNLTFKYNDLLPFYKYYLNNAGDPLDKSNFALNSKFFENYVVKYFAKIFSKKPDNVWGYVTSGGTEGNLYGLYLGREHYPNGILYYSKDAHYSISKIARILKLPIEIIDSLENGEINYQHLSERIKENNTRPVIINLNYGTTMKGAIDDLKKILLVLKENNVEDFYIHADAALFALLLAFIKGSPKLELKNLKQGVNSLSFSGHKYIGSPTPFGLVLTQKNIMEFTKNNIEYINALDTTILGSRNGHGALMFAHAIKNRTESSFKSEAIKCLDNAVYLRSCLEKLNYQPKLNEFSNIVYFKKPEDLIVKKWQLATQGDYAHIVVMQHVTKERIKKFLDDLKLKD